VLNLFSVFHTFKTLVYCAQCLMVGDIKQCCYPSVWLSDCPMPLAQKRCILGNGYYRTVMLVTHSQESCTRNLCKFFVQETCIKFWCKFLYKKLTIDKKAMANNANNKSSTGKPASRISQFWLRLCKFLASNIALFYLMQDSCTRKTCTRKHDT